MSGDDKNNLPSCFDIYNFFVYFDFPTFSKSCKLFYQTFYFMCCVM